jgi:hypothetical protein
LIFSTGVPDANTSLKGMSKTIMIRYSKDPRQISVPNSHQIAANAKPESQRVPPFITGQPRERYSAQVVVMHHFISFSPQQPMKRFVQAEEILTLTKSKGNFLLF